MVTAQGQTTAPAGIRGYPDRRPRLRPACHLLPTAAAGGAIRSWSLLEAGAAPAISKRAAPRKKDVPCTSFVGCETQ